MSLPGFLLRSEKIARRRPLLTAWLLLGAVLFLIYGASARAPLIYDDAAYMLGDARVTGPWPGLGAFFARTFTAQGEYEPLPLLLHRGLYALAGAAPAAYRLSSVLLHWLNAGLLMLLLRALLEDELLAVLAAVLYAVMPYHAETLMVSTFKKHLLVGLLGLVLLNLQVRTRSRAALAPAAALLLALALLGKESAAALVPVSGLLGWAALRPGSRAERRGLLAWQAALWAVLLGFAALRLFWLPRAFLPLVGGSWPTHLLTSAKCLAWSLGESILPLGVSLEHGLSPVSSVASKAAVLAVFVLPAAAALGVALRRLDRRASAAYACGLLLLAPFLNVVSFLNFSLVADRYLSLASMALVPCWLLAAARLSRARPRALAAPVLLAAGLAAAASARAAFLYTDPLALWARAVESAPGNPRAWHALGRAAQDAGDPALAVRALDRAVALSPGYEEARVDRPLAYAEAGRLPEAIELARRDAAERPDFRRLLNLGQLLLRAGRPKDALDPLAAAVRLAPASRLGRLDLGACEAELGRWAEAERDLSAAAAEPALRLNALHGLARAHAALGRRELAAAEYDEALAARPFDLPLLEGRARLGTRAEGAALYDAALARLSREAGRLALDAPARARVDALAAAMAAARRKIAKP